MDNTFVCKATYCFNEKTIKGTLKVFLDRYVFCVNDREILWQKIDVCEVRLCRVDVKIKGMIWKRKTTGFRLDMPDILGEYVFIFTDENMETLNRFIRECVDFEAKKREAETQRIIEKRKRRIEERRQKLEERARNKEKEDEPESIIKKEFSDSFAWIKQEEMELLEKDAQEEANLQKIGVFHTKLAGVTHSNTGSNSENRQLIIRDLYRKGLLENGQELKLVQEPTNPYDRNAIMVLGPDGRQIGYLSRQVAAEVTRSISQGIIYRSFISDVTGGSVGYSYGVNVRIESYKRITDEATVLNMQTGNQVKRKPYSALKASEYGTDDQYTAMQKELFGQCFAFFLKVCGDFRCTVVEIPTEEERKFDDSDIINDTSMYGIPVPSIKLDVVENGVASNIPIPAVIIEKISDLINQATELKRKQKYVEANSLFIDMVINKKTFSSTMALCWYKVLACSGNVGDAIRIAEYFLSLNPVQGKSTALLKMHSARLLELVKQKDYCELCTYLESLSDNPEYRINPAQIMT